MACSEPFCADHVAKLCCVEMSFRRPPAGCRVAAAVVLLSLTSGASAGSPTPMARAKRDVKTAVRRDVLGVRVGRDRLRGNLLDAAAVATGGALVFSGAAHPNAAALLQSATVADKVFALHNQTARLQTEDHAAALVAGAILIHVPVAAALVPWLVIAQISARTCEGVVNDSS
eukprot:6981843-Prymnesium_polylepis.1